MSGKVKLFCPGYPWPGGKISESPDIIKRIPKHGRKFVDLCAGRGNITFRAMHMGLQYEQWILNDILTSKFFEAIKEHGDTFVSAERSQAEYYRCKQLAK